MLNIVLYQPEIAPNTGNIIRLAANCGFSLHLIRPLGFTLEDKKLRRAGLDYAEYVNLQLHDTFQDFLDKHPRSKVYACSTKGNRTYCDITYSEGDSLLFGPETRGLPNDILTAESLSGVLTLPMNVGSRSLNLSNAVAIVSYEAWRQLDFRAPTGVSA